MKLIGLLLLGALLLFSGCFLEGGLGHGKSAQAEVKPSGPTLGEELADAEVKLLEAGLLVEEGFRCARLKLKSGEITVIDVTSSGRFDPVIAVVSKEGELIAVNDDWGRNVDSRVVLAEVPSGATLLVWELNGGQGTAQVSVSSGTSQDLSEWVASSGLATGTMESRLVEDKDNPRMEELIEDLNTADIYVSDWENAVIVPFRIAEGGYHSVALESDDFDAYLVLVALERGRPRFVAVNDDGGTGWNSRLLVDLEPGLYGAVVNSYSGRDGGRFTLSVQTITIGAGEVNWVEVPGASDGYLSGEEMAMAFWPGIDDEWHCSSINSATPVLAFGFVIEEDGLYSISASSEFDGTMTLLGYESPEFAYCMDYSDDFDGWNPGLSLNLAPGTYLALVAAYDGASVGAVSFSVEPDVEFIPDAVPLSLGGNQELRLDRRTPYGLFQLDITGGYNYAVSAESDYLDAVITLTFADGTELFDDDGGEGFNSYIEFVPEASQLGTAMLKVETYSGDGDGVINVSFTQLERLSEAQSFSLYD